MDLLREDLGAEALDTLIGEPAHQPHVPAARPVARAEDASGALELAGDVVQVQAALPEVFSGALVAVGAAGDEDAACVTWTLDSSG
jgi:hypothetical protein